MYVIAAEPMRWSAGVLPLIEILQTPLMARVPVGYQRRFLDDYVPNHSSLLPRPLADALLEEGRGAAIQRAAVFDSTSHNGSPHDQFLLELSWFSSKLEGGTKSFAQTQHLFKQGIQALDVDELVLLNHKQAGAFLLEAASGDGMSVDFISNLQAILMWDLLQQPRDLGAIRQGMLGTYGSVYTASHDAAVLQDILKAIADKAKRILNPVEAAFFLWVHVAYLQPFVGGNKRTSRVCANLPLLQHNCAPLSYWNVTTGDYAIAMLGVYEQRNLAAAVELFAFVYRRSIQHCQKLYGR